MHCASCWANNRPYITELEKLSAFADGFFCTKNPASDFLSEAGFPILCVVSQLSFLFRYSLADISVYFLKTREK